MDVIATTDENRILVLDENYDLHAIQFDGETISEIPFNVIYDDWHAIEKSENSGIAVDLLEKANDFLEKANSNRDYRGRFANIENAIPTKQLRGFITALKQQHGKHATLGNIINYFESKIPSEPVKSEFPTTEPMPSATVAELTVKADYPYSDIYYILKFKNPEALMKFAAYSKTQSGLIYEDPAEYHVTLMYVKGVDPLTGAIFADAVKAFSPVDVAVNGYGTFENADSNVLYMNVMKTDELTELQNGIYLMAQAMQLDISELCVPQDWHPHITLAYSDNPIDQSKLPDVDGAVLKGDKIEASSNYELLCDSEM